ncbi:MAG: 1-acyl-sn-glycerol-3-phosphate acyltransferase [Bacteroidales bacterium]|nr:1-acyl-sn-glycerol-3-phosphate acyltransferase [Bacteroidales bacterium]
MNKVYDTPWAYGFFRPYVDLNTKWSFRSLKIAGKENIPTDGAVIFAPNHTNTLMDALVMLQARKGPTAFGARADTFKNPTVAKLLTFFKILPISRVRDGRAALESNHAVFDEIVDCLAHDIPFCLFVEGKHRPMHSLQPIKKGVYHVGKLAEERLRKPVYIVPVGIDYSDYFHYMCDVKMSYGEPIRVSEYLDDWPALSQLLHDRIASLITYFPDDEHYETNWKAFHLRHRPRRSITKKGLRVLWALCSLPIFLICGAVCSPVLLATWLTRRKLKDMAWMNTVRYGWRLLFCIIWPFHSLFYLLLNLYRDILS